MDYSVVMVSVAAVIQLFNAFLIIKYSNEIRTNHKGERGERGEDGAPGPRGFTGSQGMAGVCECKDTVDELARNMNEVLRIARG